MNKQRILLSVYNSIAYFGRLSSRFYATNTIPMYAFKKHAKRLVKVNARDRFHASNCSHTRFEIFRRGGSKQVSWPVCSMCFRQAQLIHLPANLGSQKIMTTTSQYPESFTWVFATIEFRRNQLESP